MEKKKKRFQLPVNVGEFFRKKTKFFGKEFNLLSKALWGAGSKIQKKFAKLSRSKKFESFIFFQLFFLKKKKRNKTQNKKERRVLRVLKKELCLVF